MNLLNGVFLSLICCHHQQIEGCYVQLKRHSGINHKFVILGQLILLPANLEIIMYPYPRVLKLKNRKINQTNQKHIIFNKKIPETYKRKQIKR